MWYDELFSQLRTHDDNTVWHFHLLSTTYIAFHKTYKKKPMSFLLFQVRHHLEKIVLDWNFVNALNLPTFSVSK